jgi:hypothetical protein
MSTDDGGVYGDSEFLANRDNTTRDFRESEKETKRKIIEKMLTLRHNMKYNKHLLSVYMRAKGLFDTMVDEHRSQLEHLDEIYRHLNNLIHENILAQRNNSADARSKMMMTELVKDKKRIGSLLKKMRVSLDKLMDIDTVIGTTIENVNEIILMDDIEADEDEDESEADEDEDESEADESESDDESEADESESDDESEADESESDDDDESEADESESDDDDESEADESESDDDDESEDEDEAEDEDEDEAEDEDEDEDEAEDESGDESESEADEAEDEDETEDPAIFVF